MISNVYILCIIHLPKVRLKPFSSFLYTLGIIFLNFYLKLNLKIKIQLKLFYITLNKSIYYIKLRLTKTKVSNKLTIESVFNYNLTFKKI